MTRQPLKGKSGLFLFFQTFACLSRVLLGAWDGANSDISFDSGPLRIRWQ